MKLMECISFHLFNPMHVHRNMIQTAEDMLVSAILLCSVDSYSEFVNGY